MSKKPLILGIESSCDETAASLITENEQGIPIVLSNIVSSQVDVHKEFGGCGSRACSSITYRKN